MTPECRPVCSPPSASVHPMDNSARLHFDFPELQHAFDDQANVFVELVISTPDLAAPTALGDWDCAVLVGHVSTAIEALWRWQGDAPDSAIELDATSWWDAVDPSVNADFSHRYAAKRSHRELRDGLTVAVTRASQTSAESSPSSSLALPGGVAWARFDQVLATRIFELTVHGLDLAAATGSNTPMAGRALEISGRILDNRFAGPRPNDIENDVDWILAASGRTPHTDPTLPAMS